MHPDSAHFGASLPRELPHAVREVVSLAMVARLTKSNATFQKPYLAPFGHHHETTTLHWLKLKPPNNPVVGERTDAKAADVYLYQGPAISLL